MLNRLLPYLPALLTVLIAALAPLLSHGLEDLVGRFAPAPITDVVLVETVDADVVGAIEAARQAGATDVWMALPPNHAWLADARPLPFEITADHDGRVRRAGNLRLPLPESNDTVLRIGANQLAPGSLIARQVVVVFGDPARGMQVNVPGASEPIDLGLVGAIALATLDRGGLREIPRPIGILIVLATSALTLHVAHRTTPRQAGALAFVGATTLFVVCVAGRWVGWLLPVEGLVAAPFVTALFRGVSTTDRTWTALDRLSLRIGRPRDEATVRPGVAGLAEIAAMYSPNATVAAWAKDPEGRVIEAHHVLGDGDLPELSHLPEVPLDNPEYTVMPIVDEGNVVGALGIASSAGLGHAERTLLQALAATRQFGRTGQAPSTDPVSARIELAQESVRRALHRAEQWESVLNNARAPIGLFDIGGGMVSGGKPLRDHLSQSQEPLFEVLRGLTRRSDPDIRLALLEAIAGTGPSRLHSQSGADEVIVTRLSEHDGTQGFLVQVHDVAPYFGLDNVKSNTIRAMAFQTRNALASIEGFAFMIAAEEDEGARQMTLDMLQKKVERLVALLHSAEDLEVTKVGETPVQPLFVPEFLEQVATRIDNPRLNVEIPVAAEPVAAKRQQLMETLVLIIGDLMGQEGSVHLWAEPEISGATFIIESRGAGLPTSMFRSWVQNPEATPARARRLVEANGGRYSLDNQEGRGLRYTLRFEHFQPGDKPRQ